MVSTLKEHYIVKGSESWDMKVMGFEDPWFRMEECDNTIVQEK
jgi:hypothetical protein